MPLVSVIVAVYNVEHYIEKCIESLTGQTYRNLEILLIDDGSGDRSGEICFLPTGRVNPFFPGIQLVEKRRNL